MILKYPSWDALAFNLGEIREKYDSNIVDNVLTIKKPWEKSGTPKFKGSIEHNENGITITGTFSVSFSGLVLLALWYLTTSVVAILCLFGIMKFGFLIYLREPLIINFLTLPLLLYQHIATGF